MGFISDLFGVVNVQRIKNGGTARLSVCQITSLIVNMSDAKQFLPEDDFNSVYELFKRLRRVKKKRRMDIHGYYDTASKIVLLFNSLAPFIMYSGNAPEDAAKLLEFIEEKYGDLNLEDIEAEIFNRKVPRSRKLSIVFLALSIVLLCSSAFLCCKCIEIQNEYVVLQQSFLKSNEAIDVLSSQYMEVSGENLTLKSEVDFWSGNFVLITQSGSKYHRYGCSYAKNSNAIVSFSQAESRGYTACSHCNPEKNQCISFIITGFTNGTMQARYGGYAINTKSNAPQITMG